MSAITELLGESGSSLLVVTVALLFLIVFTKRFFQSNPYRFPPGPRPLPILGNLHILDMQQPQKTMCKLSEEYGSVFTFHMGSQKYVVLTGYEAVREALVTQAEEFGERSLPPVVKQIVHGKGIVFGNGESWKTMRRFTLSTLRDFGMGRSSMEHQIMDEANRLMEVFKKHNGKPFNPMLAINSAVSNVVCVLVFGHRFEYDDQQFLRLQQIVNENIKLLATPSMQMFNLFPMLGRWIADFKKVKMNMEENQSFFKKIYKKHKEELDSNSLRGFIDSFIDKQQRKESDSSKSYFTEENMTASSGNLFAAGTETTSTTLRWGLLLMMKNPEIQENVQAEIERVIGRERLPQLEDRKHLPYTDAVVHEIQRYGNVVPNNLLHETKVDTTFRGYYIPKGTPVIPLLTSVLFDKTQWEKPNQFNPAHFLDAQGNFRKREAFIPFSAGRRVCVGESLAKMELFLFFTTLMQTFHFQTENGVSPDDLTLDPTPGLTNSPHPYNLCAIPY